MFFSPTIYIDIISIKFITRPLAGEAISSSRSENVSCLLGYPQRGTSQTPLFNQQYSTEALTTYPIHIIHPLYIAAVRLLPSPRATGGKVEPEQS